MIIHDYTGPGHNNRQLIFSSADSLDILSRQHRIFIDGTFKSTPTLFYQVLNYILTNYVHVY